MLSYCLDIAQLPFQLSEVLMKRFIPRSGFNLQQPWGKVLKKEREREKEIKKERKREREREGGGGGWVLHPGAQSLTLSNTFLAKVVSLLLPAIENCTPFKFC